jgi:hypothetical protein
MTLHYVASRELAKPKTYFLAVDLGQAQDFTALTVLERKQVDTGKVEIEHGPVSYSSRSGFHVQATETPIYENLYAARHLERLPTGTPYPAQVKRIKELHDRLKADTRKAPHLVVDQTGVGRPVVDMLRAVGLKPISVTITGGDAVSRDGKDYKVPKRDLVSIVQVLLQAERLKIASSLREASTLTAELLAFKVSISLKGHDSYGNDAGPWRENPHDDLVLAVALAAWYGEHYKPVVDDTPPSMSFRGVRYTGRR